MFWRPSRSTSLGLRLVSIVVALAAAYAALMVASAGRAPQRLTVTVVGVVLMVVVLGAALLAHEGIHGVAISTYGGKPRFDWSVVARVVPQLVCTAPNQRFSRLRYALVVMAPSVFVSLALVVGLRSSAGGLFVIPFGIHLGVCVNDWVAVFRALREPQGSLIEDVSGGILIHPPALVA
jgi:hypothetical protein